MGSSLTKRNGILLLSVGILVARAGEEKVRERERGLCVRFGGEVDAACE